MSAVSQPLIPAKGASRDLAEAKMAYSKGDSESSKVAHTLKIKQSTEEHNQSGDYVKAIVFGGLDGILTSFAIVAGAAGAGLSYMVVLVMGFSNVLADALSMGVGEFLSSKGNNEYVKAERAREAWEMKNFPEGEIEEMIEIFEGRGMSHADATSVIQTMAKYEDFFVDLMMTEELGLQVPTEDDDSVTEGFVMFLSFASFGAMPILGYVIFPVVDPSLTHGHLFMIACVVTGVTLFVLGSIKVTRTGA